MTDDAHQLWKSWGIYAKAGHCDDCGNYDHCRSSGIGIPFLCFGCFRVVFGLLEDRSSMETTGRFTMLEPS
jgi:hypothetical protein